MGKQLSSETIYAGLYVLPRGTLRSELLTALRQARKVRRPRAKEVSRLCTPLEIYAQLRHHSPVALGT